jgi:phage terminase small subunit
MAKKAAEAKKTPGITLVSPRRAGRAPGHLNPATRRWFNQVVADFELEPHHLMILTTASDSWDRMVGARGEIARDGMTYTDRFGAPHVHPAVAIERDSRIGFLRALRELNLDVSMPDEPRPPGLGAGRRR